MVDRAQKSLIYEACAAAYADPVDANIIAEATVIRIEDRMISFSEFLQGILKRTGLQPKLRNRIRKTLQKGER